MDRATQLALNRINQRFYATVADAWQDKRKHPWPGFEQVVQGALAALRGDAGSGGLHVLDVGCGDGRFAQYLAGHGYGRGGRSAFSSYLGLDSSPAMLSLARGRALGPAFRFQQADILLDDLDDALAGARFELIAVLGVLHHIPGFRQRAALLQALARHMSHSGSLALTLWRLDEDPRFSSRIIDIAQHNQTSDEPLDPTQLEPGDRLLRWDDQPVPRYCHFPDEAELSELIANTGLQLRERFRADGHLNRMNEYVVLSP